MTWGHASSTDLVNWTEHAPAIRPNGIGAAFSGSCVVDKNNTAGFYMKLNIHTDFDIIRWFWKQPSKQGAVKKLIREEIAKKKSEDSSS